jgi:hypothetical protein
LPGWRKSNDPGFSQLGPKRQIAYAQAHNAIAFALEAPKAMLAPSRDRTPYKRN